MTLHLLAPVGSPGFCDFSISAIICSNAFPTLLFNRALASVKLQLNSSANFLPSSAWTWRWSAFRSLLFPTMTNGTQSAPCTSQTDVREQWWHRARLLARWLRILSLSIRIISNDCLEATEQTSMQPWMPMKCWELSMLYSSQ